MKDFFHKESPYETQNKLFPNKENWPEYFDDFIMKRQMISYLPAKSFTDFLRNNYRRFSFYCKDHLYG